MNQKISLLWVLGHSGIFWNEKADSLAKQVIDSKPFIDWIASEDIISNFKKQSIQITSQIVILVCSKLALQICKLAASLTRQERKCETSLQQVNASFEVIMGRTCSKLAL
ncbi:hypothetical protein AVEN_34600-1 [Araneus ventricosus]|uniref:RNase H type-1 domain-containing protein n=1 Tax=Araneus ventricosus TaxID=182803 RepID=A0A4Y2AZ91_ARAVE|nr:hypothetical protein AVEN_34600-1 [Araneus ventricosus]